MKIDIKKAWFFNLYFGLLVVSLGAVVTPFTVGNAIVMISGLTLLAISCKVLKLI